MTEVLTPDAEVLEARRLDAKPYLALTADQTN
jgi:hypothetical protein